MTDGSEGARTGLPGDSTANTSPLPKGAKPPDGGRTPGSMRCAPPTMNFVTYTAPWLTSPAQTWVGCILRVCPLALTYPIRRELVSYGRLSFCVLLPASLHMQLGTARDSHARDAARPLSKLHKGGGCQSHLRVPHSERGQQLRRGPQCHHRGHQEVCTRAAASRPPPPLSRLTPSRSTRTLYAARHCCPRSVRHGGCLSACLSAAAARAA